MRSLKLRTMTITAVVTGFMIAVSGTFILTSVGDDLYSSRRDQVLQDSARATLAAQGQVDASSASDRGALLALSASVRRTVQDTSSSQLIYVRRQPGQDFFPDAPDDFYTSPQLVDAVSTELSRAVRSGEAPQYWQPVTLTDDKTLFPINSPTLGEKDMAQLDALAARVKAMGTWFHLQIQGHTDGFGSEDYNYELGRARAEVVKAYLNEKGGIPLLRMSVISYGASEAASYAGKSNRRIVVHVLQ